MADRHVDPNPMPEAPPADQLNRRLRRRLTMDRLTAAGLAAMLAAIAFLSYGANVRADKNQRATCTLIGVVDRQTRLTSAAVGAIIASPEEQAGALERLAQEVKANQRKAQEVAAGADCP